MRLAFMGSDPIVLPLLNYFKGNAPAGFHLQCVYTQPDRRSGRGMHLRPNAIKSWALENDVEVRQPLKCGTEEADYLKANDIGLILVMAYGQILPRSILEAAPLGVLNLHASLLPRLRGASPIHTAVALGDKATGLCLMQITAKLDAGPVADEERVPILPDDTVGDVHKKLAHAGPLLLERNLPAIAAGNLSFVEQDLSKVTYCRIIEKSDCHLDFGQPAAELANRIRAFHPWPGTSFPYEGTEVRILEATVEENASPDVPPGTILIDPPGTLGIACGNGILKPLKLQRPSGKPLPVDAFIRGFTMVAGTVLESRGMGELESPQPFPYKRK